MEYLWLADSAGLNADSILTALVSNAFNDSTGGWNCLTDPPTYSESNADYEAALRTIALALTDTMPAGEAPDTTTLVTPTDGSTNDQPTVFSWTAVSGATTYWLRITDDDGETYAINLSAIADTFYSVSGLIQSTVYTWQVAAGNDDGWSDWTTSWGFTTAGASSLGRHVILIRRPLRTE